MALPAGGGNTLPVPLDTFSGRHRTLGYAVNGIPLPTQPYLATAPVVQGSLINTGKRFTLFFASPDSQTLALLASGAIVTLQFLLADGRAPSATVQITSSLSNATLLVDVLLLNNAPVLPSSSPFIHLKQDGSLMTANVFGEIPNDIKDKPILGLYDPVTHSAVAAQAGTTVTDNTNSVVYAPLAGGGGGGGGGAVTVADGADVAEGATTSTVYSDGTGAAAGTSVGLLKGLFKKLAGVLGIQQTDLTQTGTISAAQPSINSPVASATVVLSVGQGQSSWKAQLANGGGGFTSGTTIVADQSVDGGTTWVASSFKVAGSLTNTPVLSVVGPGPIVISGDCAASAQVRIRCSALNSTETIAVNLRSGAGTGAVGLLSSIPAGTNNIGSINVANTNNNGQALMVASAPVVPASDYVGPIKRSGVAVYSLASTASTGATQNSGDLIVAAYTEIAIDINMTAQSGTSPTIQFFWDRKGADGIYYPIYQSAVYTTATNVLSVSVGSGMSYTVSLGLTGRLRWVVGGSATPTYTFSANVVGK